METNSGTDLEAQDLWALGVALVSLDPRGFYSPRLGFEEHRPMSDKPSFYGVVME
jgi:hypothetical protein